MWKAPAAGPDLDPGIMDQTWPSCLLVAAVGKTDCGGEGGISLRCSGRCSPACWGGQILEVEVLEPGDDNRGIMLIQMGTAEAFGIVCSAEKWGGSRQSWGRL